MASEFLEFVCATESVTQSYQRRTRTSGMQITEDHAYEAG